MRAEDIIADFLAKFDPARRQPEDAARDLLAELNKHELHVAEEYELAGGEWD
jgi:hypothetical protein